MTVAGEPFAALYAHPPQRSNLLTRIRGRNVRSPEYERSGARPIRDKLGREVRAAVATVRARVGAAAGRF